MLFLSRRLVGVAGHPCTRTTRAASTCRLE